VSDNVLKEKNLNSTTRIGKKEVPKEKLNTKFEKGMLNKE
jgi:hypothetical protein